MDKTPIKKEAFVGTPTVREFAQHFMETYAEPRNKPSELIAKRQILRAYIVPLFGDFKLDEIQNEHIDVFVSRLRAGGASAKTVNNRLAVLHKMLKYAHSRKMIKHVPVWEPLKVPAKDQRFLTVAECGKLLEAAKDQGPYWYAMVCIGLHLGLRNGEIRALQWKDIDTKAQTVRINRADYRGHISTPKSAAGHRTLPLNETVREALHRTKKIGPLIFGKPPKGNIIISHETTRNRLRIICREAGVKKCGWHTLRHTYASHLAMSGVPLRVLQDLLGHSTLQMTARYSHLTPESRTKATDVLVDLFKPKPRK